MDNTEYLKQLADAEKKNKQIELEQAKAEALKTIGQQEATTMPTFTAKKQQANVQSQLGAKNLAEYWANRGQTNAGISAQSELSRGNVLGNTLQGIGQAEMAQQQSFNQARDTVGTEYQNQFTNFSNQVDQELTSNLYQDRVAQQEAATKAAQQAFENQLAVAKYNLSVSNADKSSTSKTPLTKAGNYSNIVIPYTTDKNKPITNAVIDGDNVIYNLSNGSTIKFKLGTNPYTGTLNKDAIGYEQDVNGNQVKVLKTWDNGYQPNNVDSKPLAMSGAVVQNPKNGENVKVWTTGQVGDGTADHFYWDSTTNKYQKLTESDKRVLKISNSNIKPIGGTSSAGYTKGGGIR